MWVLMYPILLWGILNFWPEQWCLQVSGIIVGCTALAYLWIYCIDPSLLFVWLWSLRPLQNCPLLPWSYWLMMCMRFSWSVHLVWYVPGEYLFRNDLLGCILAPVSFTWFTRSTIITGNFRVTAVPKIVSCVRWRRFCSWIHCSLSLFLKKITCTLIFVPSGI